MSFLDEIPILCEQKSFHWEDEQILYCSVHQHITVDAPVGGQMCPNCGAIWRTATVGQGPDEFDDYILGCLQAEHFLRFFGFKPYG